MGDQALDSRIARFRDEDALMAAPWCVYSWESGVVYLVRPSTETVARAEQRLLNEPLHEAMPIADAQKLRRAHSYGRMFGVEQVRKHLARNTPDSESETTCSPKCCASCSNSFAELRSCDREACACVPTPPDSGSD